MDALRLTHERLVATDHVLVERWCLIGKLPGPKAAIGCWDALRARIVRAAEVTARDLDRAREIVECFPDQMFSLVDATSFAVMEREETETASAFDAHSRVHRPGRDCHRR